MIGDWNAKAGSQEIPGVTDKFGLEVQNEVGQRLTEFCQENTLFQQHNRQFYTRTSLDGQSKPDCLYSLRPNMKKLHSQRKEDLELTVAQIISSLLENSSLN